MLPHEYEIDQQRCEQQDAIAEQIYIDGFGDAIDGKSPHSEDEAYQFGYVQRKAQLNELVHQANHINCYRPFHDCDWLEDGGGF